VALGQGLARAALSRLDAVGNAIPRLEEIALDVDVLLFTSTATIATGLLFGIVPALQIGGTGPRAADLRSGLASGPPLRSLRKWLVVGQNALTVILLLGAGLLITSFVNLTSTELGYDPNDVLTFNIPQPPLEFPAEIDEQPQRTRFEQEVASRIRELPGVEAAGFTNALPMVQMRLTIPIRPQDSPNATFEADMYTVSPDYFRAMGIRILGGRGFAAEDGAAARPVYAVPRANAVRCRGLGPGDLCRRIDCILSRDARRIVPSGAASRCDRSAGDDALRVIHGARAALNVPAGDPIVISEVVVY
jgi:hypothetical protein